MLNSDISFFKNRVDPDQLASKKPADYDLLCKYMLAMVIPVS